MIQRVMSQLIVSTQVFNEPRKHYKADTKLTLSNFYFLEFFTSEWKGFKLRNCFDKAKLQTEIIKNAKLKAEWKAKALRLTLYDSYSFCLFCICSCKSCKKDF